MKYLFIILLAACAKSGPQLTPREAEIQRELTLKPNDSLMWEVQGLRFDYPDSLSVEGVPTTEYNSWNTVTWSELTTYTLYAHFKNGGTVLKVTGHTDAPGNEKTNTLAVIPGIGKTPIYRIRKGVNVFTFTQIKP